MLKKGLKSDKDTADFSLLIKIDRGFVKPFLSY